jgi:predicted AlkP superfamily pyrophosphatase or phosphodiesterase
MRIFFKAFFLLLAGFSLCKAQSREVPPVLIVVSIDGYRYDYTNLYQPPNLLKIRNSGSYSERMNPAYPSKTFPNHYTLATGLYPGEHGIVDNTFFDKKKGETFRVGDRAKVEDAYWYGGEPIWNTAKKNGLKAASYFWVGSEAPVNGSFPDYFFKYDETVPYEKRIEQAFRWIDMPENERPSLIMLYFENVDNAGHNFAPNSKEVKNAIHKTDSVIGKLVAGLDERGVPYNLIITSDHGMLAYNTKDDALSFKDLIDRVTFPLLRVQNNQFQIHINPLFRKHRKAIYNQLKSLGEGKYDVYLRKETPKHWYYRGNERVGEILIVPKSPYFFFKDRIPEENEIKGNHGPDPEVVPEMRTIIYAKGHDIKSGVVLDNLENVELYPFMCELLRIPVKGIHKKRYKELKKLIDIKP